MSYRCERCGKTVEKLIPIDDADSSAQYSEICGVPYPCTDNVCITCAREILGISDKDLIREERMRARDTDFLLNKLKGQLAQVVLETIFQEFGYEVYPYGYESYLTNIIKFMRRKDANIPVRKMRATPDLFIYDREINEGFFLEVKATTDLKTNYRISQSILQGYQRYWPESILVVYCLPSMNIYCRPLNEISIDQLVIKQFPVTGGNNYVINLEQDFQLLPDHFRLIDAKGYQEFCNRVRGVVSQFTE
jgi:DNA-directed RNA polymerase subunit RPC12/RpoP